MVATKNCKISTFKNAPLPQKQTTFVPQKKNHIHTQKYTQKVGKDYLTSRSGATLLKIHVEFSKTFPPPPLAKTDPNSTQFLQKIHQQISENPLKPIFPLFTQLISFFFLDPKNAKKRGHPMLADVFILFFWGVWKILSFL